MGLSHLSPAETAWNGYQIPDYTFNSDNPSLRPLEIIELWNKFASGQLSRVRICSNGASITVYTQNDLLGIAFGVLLGSVEEPKSEMALSSGATVTAVRREKGDPVFSLSGSITDKLNYLSNLLRIVPGDVPPPITLRYQDHEMVLEFGYEISTVMDGLRLCKKP